MGPRTGDGHLDVLLEIGGEQSGLEARALNLRDPSLRVGVPAPPAVSAAECENAVAECAERTGAAGITRWSELTTSSSAERMPCDNAQSLQMTMDCLNRCRLPKDRSTHSASAAEHSAPTRLPRMRRDTSSMEQCTTCCAVE